METIMTIEGKPNDWKLHGIDIQDGTMLEIQYGVDWVMVRAGYDYLLRELRFYALKHPEESFPILEGTRARWIEQ